MSTRNHLTFPIGVVARTCGVSEHTIRAWERRYGAVHPLRSVNGRRVYSESDLERLKMLSRLSFLGYGMKDLVGLNNENLLALVEEGHRLEPLKNSKPTHLLANYQDKVFEMLTNFQLEDLAKFLNQCRLDMPIPDYVLYLMVPLLGTLGRLVKSGEVDVVKEHAFSAIIRDQLGQIQVFPWFTEQKVIFATPDGNYHEFGIFLASILCKCYGIRAHYLGASHPPRALAKATESLGVTKIIIGNTALPEELKSLTLSDYMEQLELELNHRCDIWYGGVEEPIKTRNLLKVEYVPDFLALDRLIRKKSFGLQGSV